MKQNHLILPFLLSWGIRSLLKNSNYLSKFNTTSRKLLPIRKISEHVPGTLSQWDTSHCASSWSYFFYPWKWGRILLVYFTSLLSVCWCFSTSALRSLRSFCSWSTAFLLFWSTYWLCKLTLIYSGWKIEFKKPYLEAIFCSWSDWNRESSHFSSLVPLEANHAPA